MVLANFGVETWEAVTSVNWVRYEYYPDEWTYDLISKTSDKTGLNEAEILEMYGKFALQHLKDEGYDNLLRCLGADLLSWLSNVNALHENISSALPKLVPPEIKCKETKEDEITLFYQSPQGPRFAPALQGLVTEVAKEYFGCDVRMDRLTTQGIDDASYTIWSIKQVGIVSMVPDLRKSVSEVHRLKLREELGVEQNVEQSGRISLRNSARQGLHSGRYSSLHSVRNSGRNSGHILGRSFSDRCMSDNSSHTNTTNSSAMLYSSIWRQALEESSRSRVFARHNSDYADSCPSPHVQSTVLENPDSPKPSSKRTLRQCLSSFFSRMGIGKEHAKVSAGDIPHSIDTSSSRRNRLTSRKPAVRASGPNFGLSGAQLNDVFPFHIVFNRDLIILQTGQTLVEYIGSDLKGLNMDRLFNLEKPKTTWLSWPDFVFTVSGHSLEIQSNISRLKLVGQVLFSRDECVATFLCTPNVSNLSDMTHQGITVNDLSKHDCRLKMILASEHLHSETEAGYRLATMSRQLEREREVSMALMKESAEHAENMLVTKKAFVRHVSHEIRTPLMVAKLGLDLLEKDMAEGESSAESRNNITDCQEAIDIAVTIVSDLLSYEKLESGILQLYCDMLPAMPFVDRTMGPFSLQAKQKNITFGVQCVDKCCENVLLEIDGHKMSQVLRNLVSNALKFTPEGGNVSVSVSFIPNFLHEKESAKVSNGQYYQCGRARIEVSDTGVGLSKENQERVFKEIVQFSPDVLQGGGGSGLGLWISQGIVSLHEGVIGVTSEGEGHGCTFYVELSAYRPVISRMDRAKTTSPALNIEEDTFTEAQTEISFSGDTESSLSMNSKHFRSRHRLSCDKVVLKSSNVLNELTILVADDAAMIRKVITRVLSAKGAICEPAEDGNAVLCKVCDVKNADVSSLQGSEGASHINLKYYDVILMDYIMPNIDGPTCTAILRRAGYTGLIIGVTGNVMPDDVETFEMSGANAVLPKPLSVDDVEKCIYRFRNKDTQ
eukprot:CAMPEP_0185033670 /NCGR_PEP_ID=MMETSP1103-20130426/22844_1 /TAXON_ID=36769 /ORGANISM="Paraphysomonas bandaiensis, Strain Caron Lab Isolate" /LENGTH=1002 /DNA_ID=CAMNT_0027570033 /DNA_START=123 /DNA_END=3131 /DNA_ORIENTATION=-